MAKILRLFKKLFNGHTDEVAPPTRKGPSKEHLAILEQIEELGKKRRHLNKQKFV